MTSPLSVGVIGLGAIACGYDVPEGPAIQTHLKACWHDARLRVTAVSDIDLHHAEMVRTRWAPDAEVLDAQAIVAAGLDILCVSTPDDTHLDYLHRIAAAEHPPRLILCEKPVANALAPARAALDALAARGTIVSVNFLRRFIPGAATLLADLRAGAYGAPLAARAIVYGGFRHNGVHALDLIAAAIGTTVRSAGPSIGMGRGDGPDDPAIAFDFVLDAGRQVPVAYVGVDRGTLSVFEVDLLFERARLRFGEAGGVRMMFDTPEPASVAGFAPELQRTIDVPDVDNRVMAGVWSNLAAHLLDGAPLASPPSAALEALMLLNSLQKTLPAMSEM